MAGEGFNLGNAYGAVIIDVSGVSSAMRQAQGMISGGLSGIGASIGGGLQSVGSGIESMGQSITGVGLKIGTLVAPIALFARNAIMQFTSFDEAMTNIQAVTGASTDEIKTLGDKILEIGKNSRSGPQAVAEAFYDIAGGVTDASVRMPTLVAAVHAAEAGNADLGTTTKALIAIMNGYGFSADKAGYASDVLTQTVAKGVGSMNDFATALPDVAGLASTLGISFEDLGAQMAFITTKGISASEAGTQLTGMMVSLINPTQDMQDALKKIGFESGNAAIKQLGLAGTFKKFKDSGIDVTRLGGRIEAMRGAINLSSDAAKSFLDNFNLGLDGLTEKTRQIQNASPAAQLDFFNSSMSTIAITIGQSLAPALTNLLGKILPVMDSILAWVRANPELVAQIGMIVGAFAVAAPIIAAVGLVLSTIGTIIGAIGAAIALVLSPIGLIIGAIVALYVAFQNNFLGIRDFLQPIFDSIVDFFAHFTDRVKLYWSLFQLYFAYYITNPLSDFWNNIVQPALQPFLDWFNAPGGGLDLINIALNNFKTNVFDPVVTLVAAIWENVKTGVGNFATWFTTGGLQEIVKKVNEFKTNSIDPLIKAIQDIWTKVQPFLELLKNGIKTVFDWINTNVIQPMMHALDELLLKIFSVASLSDTSQNGGQTGANAVAALKNKIGLPSGVQPIPPVGGGSATPLRDIGGPGMAGMAYQIGSGQLKNEVYIPGADGQFVSGFVDLMKQVAASASGQGSGGDTINVMMPESALANPARAYAAGQDFGRGVSDEMRARGVKPLR